MCKRLNDNALHSTAVWRRSSLSECVHRCLKTFTVVGRCTELSECVIVVWMGPPLSECVHRCLNGSNVAERLSQSSVLLHSVPPDSELYSLGSCPRGRHTTFWLNRHDSVNTYIVLFLSGGYRPGMRLILNFSKLFLKIVWKYRFFIYLCIEIVLNVSNLEQWKHPQKPPVKGICF